ncbi:glutathione S-transferase A4-like [Branchiostoma lanceolatum]|uniref:glutathione S-transferase A4-like n=1 Tax=Branchiostoma lanceolatum TaxID=7740 RepID=UPI0034549588
MSEPGKPKLTYFNGRGQAESVRLVLAAAGIEFDEKYVETKEELEKLREGGDLLFLQLPLLEINGVKLVQVGAIVRHVARRAALYGKNNVESAKCDMLAEGARDFNEIFNALPFAPDRSAAEDEIQDNVLPRWLPIFEQALDDNGTGFLVGTGMTFADVALLEPLLTISELYPYALEDYSKLEDFLSYMREVPNLAKYLNSSHRKPPADDKYVELVQGILS